MSDINKNKNRASLRVNTEAKYQASVARLQRDSFSASENQRTEIHVADPNYVYTRTNTGSAPMADQANPNSTPPLSAEVWDLKGYSGGHGYLVLSAAEDVDIELWARDEQSGAWFLVDTLTDIPGYTEFRFPNIRGRKIWMRLTNIGTSLTSVAMRFSAE